MEFGILVFVLLVDVVVFRWANRVSEKLDENRMLVTEKIGPIWLVSATGEKIAPLAFPAIPVEVRQMLPP